MVKYSSECGSLRRRRRTRRRLRGRVRAAAMLALVDVVIWGVEQTPAKSSIASDPNSANYGYHCVSSAHIYNCVPRTWVARAVCILFLSGSQVFIFMCLIATVILRKVPKILSNMGKFLKFSPGLVCVCVLRSCHVWVYHRLGSILSHHPAFHETNSCVYVWFNLVMKTFWPNRQ